MQRVSSMCGPLAPGGAPVYDRAGSFAFLEWQGSVALFKGQMVQPAVVCTKIQGNGDSYSSQVDHEPFMRSREEKQGLPLTRIDWSQDPERFRLSTAPALLDGEMEDNHQSADWDSGHDFAWRADETPSHQPGSASVSPVTIHEPFVRSREEKQGLPLTRIEWSQDPERFRLSTAPPLLDGEIEDNHQSADWDSGHDFAWRADETPVHQSGSASVSPVTIHEPFVRSREEKQGLPLTRIDWSQDPERLRLSTAPPLPDDEMEDDHQSADWNSGQGDAWRANETQEDHQPGTSSVSPVTMHEPFVLSREEKQGLPLTRIDWSQDPERLRLSTAPPLLDDEVEDDHQSADWDCGRDDAWRADETPEDHQPGETSVSPVTLVLCNMPIRGNPKDLLWLLQRSGFWEPFEFLLLPMKHGARKNKGLAYVGLPSAAAAQRFVEAVDGSILPGRKSAKQISVQSVDMQIPIDLRDAYSTTTCWGPVFWTEDRPWP